MKLLVGRDRMWFSNSDILSGIGREKTLVLTKGKLEMPSDVIGLYTNRWIGRRVETPSGKGAQSRWV